MATDTSIDRSKFSYSLSMDRLVIVESYTLLTDVVGEYPSISGLPSLWSAHPNYPNAILEDINITPTIEQNRVFYYAILTYKSIEGTNPGSITPNQTIFDFDVGTVEKEIDRDLDGNPLTNSSGEPPQTDLTKKHPVLILNASKTYDSLDVVNWANHVGKLNSQTWTPSNSLLSFPEKHCQCIGMSVNEFTNDSSKFNVKFKFLYDENKHVLQFLDNGYTYYDTDQSNRIIPNFENLDKEPIRLNGYGGKFGQALVNTANTSLGLPAGATRISLPNSASTAIYLKWDINNITDFNSLGL